MENKATIQNCITVQLEKQTMKMAVQDRGYQSPVLLTASK